MLGAPAAQVAGVNLRVEVPRPRRGARNRREECRDDREARQARPAAASKPAGSRKPKTRRRKPDQDEISTRAYFIHLEEGGGDQLA